MHFLRVTGKRLRGVLRIARTHTGSRKWPDRHSEAIRRAAAELSRFRDAAVANELLSKREEKERNETMRDLWRQWRSWRGVHVVEETAPPPKNLTRLLLRMEEAEERLARWVQKKATAKCLIRGWKRGAKDLRDGADAFFQDPCDLAAHEWRKQMKALSFQTDWLHAMGLTVPLEDIRPLDRLSAALGRANDLSVLQALLWQTNGPPWRAEERLLLDGHLETLKRKAWRRVSLNWRKISAVLSASQSTPAMVDR